MTRSSSRAVPAADPEAPVAVEPSEVAASPSDIGLPPEVRRFLSQAEAHTLLVRGPPGSGKTTLALTLLESLPGRRVLVTSRVPADLLARHHAWLRDARSRVEVVESKVRSGDLRASARVASLWKAQGRALPMEPSTSGLTARDVEQLAWLPLELRELWLSLDPATPATVAIDSWDALVDLYLSSGDSRLEGTPSRGDLERMLFDQVARSGSRLLLVLERDDQSQLDYLSDGVITTSVERSGDRTERWLRLLKLRGVEITDSDYPFTLAGARFRSFPALPPLFRVDFAGCDPEPNPYPRHIWPGSTTFAAAFGWFPWEQSTLIELDSTVSYEVVRTLIAPVITHVLRVGGRALLASPPSRAYSDVVDMYRGAAPEELVRRNLRIMRMRDAPDPGDELGRAVAMQFTGNGDPRGGDPVETESRAGNPRDRRFLRFRDVYGFLTTPNAPGIPNVSVGFVPTWRMLSAEVADEGSPERYVWGVHRFTVGAPLHVIQVDRRDDAAFDHLAKTAGMHIRVRERAGHIWVHGVRPWTPDYAFVAGEAPGPDRAPYELVRVV